MPIARSFEAQFCVSLSVWLMALGCGGSEATPVAHVTVPSGPTVAATEPTFVTLDSNECSFVGIPARIGWVLVLPSDEYDRRELFRLHLESESLPWPPQAFVGNYGEDAMDACCDGDVSACDGFAFEVDESLVDITTLDVVAHRERNPPVHDDDSAMVGGPSFAYCECGDETRRRTDFAAHCPNGLESASFLHVYAEFVASGRRYRLLNDRQWDAFSVVPPRLERRDANEWAEVSPVTERNTGDASCPRHHYRGGGFGAYWSADANVLVVGYELEGPSQSFCQPGIHYAAYVL